VCGNEDPSRPAVVAALIDLGANPNLTDHRRHYPGGSSGWTALIEALHHEQFATAQLLIERGADTSIASNEGMSPRQMAEAEGAPPTLVARLSAR
jgi:ankyrin repeat protein